MNLHVRVYHNNDDCYETITTLVTLPLKKL